MWFASNFTSNIVSKIVEILCFRFKRLYKRNARWWSVYALKSPKTYGYIRELQTKIVAKRLSSGEGMPVRRPQRPDDPRRLGPLPPIPPPPTAELAKTQLRRGGW